MSINFENEIPQELRNVIKEEFGDAVVAQDEKTTLLNRMDLSRKFMKQLANESGQPVSAEINSEGDIKTMSGGTRYRLTQKGWVKI